MFEGDLAEIKRAGTDITIVATSSMVPVALGAAKMLEEVGISAEGTRRPRSPRRSRR